MSEQQDLIYDWNVHEPRPPRAKRVTLDDETLRDGLQSPSVHDPKIGDKIEILNLMNALSIDTADIGLPGAGPRAVEDVTRNVQNLTPADRAAAAYGRAADICDEDVEICRAIGRNGLAVLEILSAAQRSLTTNGRPVMLDARGVQTSVPVIHTVPAPDPASHVTI